MIHDVVEMSFLQFCPLHASATPQGLKFKIKPDFFFLLLTHPYPKNNQRSFWICQHSEQWWILDFPDGGRVPISGAKTYYLATFFPEYCTKMKESALREGVYTSSASLECSKILIKMVHPKKYTDCKRLNSFIIYLFDN